MKIETIVVTGNIGSGKSRVLKAIKENAEAKVEFFSFDEYTRELYEREDVKQFLTMMFGTTDRAKISDIIFKSNRQMGKTETVNVMLEELNSFFFKIVEAKFVQLASRKPTSTLVIEMPMYFEMKEKSYDMQLIRTKVKVVTVICDDDIRKSRVSRRDGASEEKIDAIMSTQLSQEFKARYADYVIDTTNNDTDFATKQLMETHFKKVFYDTTVSST